MSDDPHTAYARGSIDYGDYSTIRLCVNYDDCGGEVGPESQSGLCRECAQAERREAEEAVLQHRRLINHRIHTVGELARAWWAATEPQPDPAGDALRDLMRGWRREVTQAERRAA